ncbi:MAG: NlpC/P60 family protein [Candidatus Saccharibacteria bacterium]
MIGEKSVRYRKGDPEYGQSPTEGFDCSGFVRYVLLKAGLVIPDYIGADNLRRPIRHANEFWDHYGVAAHAGQQQPGDLLFFSRQGFFPTHVGIVYGAASYIHAPGRDGTYVAIESLEEADIPNRTDGQHVLYMMNPIGYKALTIVLESPSYRHHQRPIEPLGYNSSEA